MAEFDSAVVDIISNNPRDVPFAALYHVDVKTTDVEDKQLGKKSGNTKPSSASMPNNSNVKCQLRLAGKVGIPDNHPSMPSTFSIVLNQKLRESRASLIHMPGSPTLSVMSGLSGTNKRTSTPSDDGGLKLGLDSWPVREALQSRRIVLVEDCSSLIEGFPVRVWDELPNAAVVVPINNESDEGISNAVIIIGLSIRRPFDDDYEQFLVSDHHFMVDYRAG
jgi:hypothetical protein